MNRKIAGLLRSAQELVSGYGKGYAIYEALFDTPEEDCLVATVSTSRTGPELGDRITQLLEKDMRGPISHLRIRNTGEFAYGESVISNTGRGDMDCAQEGFYPGRR